MNDTHLEQADRMTSSKKGIGRFVPRILLAIFAFGLLTLFIQVTNSFSPQTTEASSSVSVTCDVGDGGKVVQTAMVVHRFSSIGEFNKAQNEDQGAFLVGAKPPTGCSINGNFCQATGSCTTGKNGQCSVSSSVPPCSVVQLDCLGVNGGSIAFNGSGCPTPPPPPPQTHLECRNNACVSVSGAGSNTCNSNNDCKPVVQKHNVCRNQACVSVNGGGTNECRLNSDDCKVQTHTVCKGQSCQVKNGPGKNECRLNSDDCVPQTHTSCEGQACVVKQGPGSNQCRLNSNDCVPKTHYSCEGFTCVLKQGPGRSDCRPNSSDCVPVKHNVCNDNYSCTSVFGPGQNQCLDNSDCKPAQHNICQNQSCVVTSGPGQNQCNLNSDDCKIPTHRECSNQACVVVSGPGSNQCDNDNQCIPSRHLECVNQACQLVDGGGVDRCSTDSQCRPVVNQNTFCDNLNVNPQSGTVLLNVVASLSGHTDNGGSIVSYKFNFGDGTGEFMQTGQSLSHTYNRTGTFVLNGWVVDDRNVQAGGSGSCQKVVTVTPPGVTPPPPGQVLGTIPSTGAETAVIPALFGTGIVGWALRKLKIKK